MILALEPESEIPFQPLSLCSERMRAHGVVVVTHGRLVHVPTLGDKREEEEREKTLRFYRQSEGIQRVWCFGPQELRGAVGECVQDACKGCGAFEFSSGGVREEEGEHHQC